MIQMHIMLILNFVLFFNSLTKNWNINQIKALQLIRLADKHGFKQLREEMYRAYVSGG